MKQNNERHRIVQEISDLLARLAKPSRKATADDIKRRWRELAGPRQRGISSTLARRAEGFVWVSQGEGSMPTRA